MLVSESFQTLRGPAYWSDPYFMWCLPIMVPIFRRLAAVLRQYCVPREQPVDAIWHQFSAQTHETAVLFGAAG
jgi:hypothetical protein